jgi:hypothetical protein
MPHPAGVSIERVDLRSPAGRRRLLSACADRYRLDRAHVMAPRAEALRRLNPAENPRLAGVPATGLLAHRRGQPAGSATALAPPGAHAWFATFECADDDPEVARALLDEAGRWAARAGRRSLIGPVGLSLDAPAGVLVRGFTRPHTYGTPHNPVSYPELLRACGLTPRWRLPCWRWELDPSGPFEDRSARAAARAGLQIRAADLSALDAELPAWRTALRAAAPPWWPPPTDEELDQLAHELPRLSVQGLVHFAERGGAPVGLAVAVPDVNQIVPRTGRVGPLAWWRLMRGRAAIPTARVRLLTALDGDPATAAALLSATAAAARGLGARRLELSCTTDEDHAAHQAIRETGAHLDRCFEVWGMDLRAAAGDTLR